METTRKFWQRLSVEPEHKRNCSRFIGYCQKDDRKINTCIGCDYHELYYPDLTSDQVLALEHLVFKACDNLEAGSSNEDSHVYTVITECTYCIWEDYTDVDMYNSYNNQLFMSWKPESDVWGADKMTRPEALASLIIQLLEANVLTVEAVRVAVA